MISDTWDGISSQIKKSILEQRSILSQFPPEAAVITSREIVLSLAADCSCKKEAEYSLAQAINEATSIQTVQKRALGRHASSDVTRGGNGGGSRLSTLEAEARSKGFSVKLNTEADLQWVMQAINYGLTMPPENWEIVAHSVHIYCDWLGCLLPAPVQSHGQKGGQQLPHALLAHPVSYAPRLLFALCRFFTPRNVSKTGASDLTDTLFSLLHQSPREPPDPACTGAIKDIVKGIVSASTLQTSTGTGSAVAGEAERWLQKKYIPLVSCIVNRIEQILNTSHLLTGTLWDRLLEFSLAVGFAVLSIPPQIESSAITTSRPFSQSPGLRGMLQLESMIVTMLIRVWLRAMAQHYPTNPYWEGLQELCRVARHRIGSSYVWSRVMVIFTFNLLRPYVIQDLSSPPTIRFTHTDKVSVLLDSPPFSAFQPLMGRQLISDLPSKIQELSWFRLLHIFGNPVDLCYPTEITHTAVFEYFRRSNSASRCRLTAAFLPAIFYHLMRSFSTMVDLFLGISPSLSGSLSTFTGVPQNLFGPLADVAEYFQYASVRSPDTAILEKYRGVIEQNASATDLPAKTDSVPVDSAVSTTSLANLVRNAGLSSNVDPQSLAEAWLQSDLLVTCFYNRPKVTSFIKLLGPWLFDAASGMRTVSNTSGNKGTIVSDPSLKVDNISFHVGRAEAMACLCRIFIYARKTQLTFSRLARFYLCLVNALTVDPEVEYVLSTVLFHSPDLLRADLPGSFSLLAVPLFNTVQWILKKPSVICPEYISMVLLRRASLHQLLSMACLSNRLEGVQFQELSSSGSTELAGLSTRALRTKLARILCDFLGYETDTHNLRMLLSAAYTLVLDMISVESSSRSFKTKSLTDGGAEQPLTLETASGLYGILLEKICGCLRKWMNDFAASSFALDVLCGMANAPVPQPDIARCRHCIQSICGFIATQCQREKKDHTRSLHSLIINAFNCLGVWIVAHPYALNDHDTLKAVVETTKLGIFGAESAPTAVQMGSSEENLPMPSAMPFSKRVNEAAEHLLSTLFSTAGSFPPLTGPETVSCCLNEELITQLTKSKISPFQHFVASSFSNSIGLGSLNSDVIISLSEVVGWPTTQVVSSDNDQASSVQLRSLAEPLPVYTFLRDNSGRHLWSWRLRYEPRNGDYNERISGSCSSRTLKPKDMRHSKSCLENCWPKKMTSEAEDPFMPRTVDNIVLVRAEKEMPTLAQSVMSPRAREEVDILKSLINSETNRLNSFVRRIRDERIKNWSSPYPNEGHCKPDQPADRLSSSHLLTCHLGYVPVNSLQPSSNSFRASNDSPPSTTTQNPTNRRPAPSIDGHRIPGTKGVGGTVESVSLIPSALTPLDSTLIRNIDSLLVAGQRSTASLFVFYVKNGQTSLTDVIANMNTWSETPKDLQSFVCSLGWQVDIKHHPGWRGPLRGVLPPTITATSHLSGFDARQKFPSATEFIRSAPDGVENVFYWADASTEVATLCPSNYTNVERKSPEEKCTADDFRAAVLWLESWDDALWSPSWAGKANSGSPAMNPLQSSLVSEFDCSLIILIHPLVNNGLFRIGILRPKEIGHEAGPLTTGLLLSAPLLGSMVRSTLTSTLHRLASDADSAFVTAGEGGTASRRQRLSMAFGSGGEKGKRPASAVELLLWSAERCY
ncbi:unnamed protein product [Hymenolepis diminuta]|uniref:Rap-GAP domain-containing protein n=1 Tax=Hymenolepis diminuta TaxID=6216 RepID=A0A564Z1C1_HYMDI|nr:unnamed protein product [Hymenolepis diminuta]